MNTKGIPIDGNKRYGVSYYAAAGHSVFYDCGNQLYCLGKTDGKQN